MHEESLRYSVLMPLYFKDNPTWFELSLGSMTSQTVRPAEIIIIHEHEITGPLEDVIDNAKEDNPDIAIIDMYDPSLKGKSLGGILAKGVERSSCELIARMDSDDISVPDRCEKQLAAFLAFPDVSIVGGWTDEFDADIDHITAVRRVPATTAEIRRFAATRCPFNHPTVMYRRGAVLEAGNYSDLARCEDYDLWTRMLSSGKEAINLQESLVYYRAGEGQKARRRDRETYRIRRGIKRRMYDRGEMSRAQYAWSMAMDIASEYAPMPVFSWATDNVLRSKKENGR